MAHRARPWRCQKRKSHHAKPAELNVEVPVVKKLSILLVDEERQAVTDHFGVALVASVVVSEEQLRKDQIPTGRSADSLSATRA